MSPRFSALVLLCALCTRNGALGSSCPSIHAYATLIRITSPTGDPFFPVGAMVAYGNVGHGGFFLEFAVVGDSAIFGMTP